jgi:hypothetical protein
MESLKGIWFSHSASAAGLALLLLAGGSLSAQQAQQPDPGKRAVRLSDVEGSVSISLGNQVIADPALTNTPLFEGTLITTKEDGRAEVQFDDGSVVRISPNSSLKLVALRQQGSLSDSDVALEGGLAYFELQGDTSTSHIRATFGDAVASASGFTVLRINLDNPPGEIAVFSGNAHLERGSAVSLDLHGGESVALNATDPNLYNLAENIEPDSWDSWNADRDQVLTAEESARTAATNSVGNSNNPAWGDLDANGNWYSVPGQGYVWSPNEAANAGWDPYGCGNWVSTPGYGYTWVSCESWGYMPYESGMWNYYDGLGWGWAPGLGGYWWNQGGWISNIGTGPIHYQPPRRPHNGPVRPGGVVPYRVNGMFQARPVIAVNRIPEIPANGSVRASGGAVTIAGNLVQPLRPISPRPAYDHERGTSVGVNRPTYGYGISAKSGYVPWANSIGSRGSSSGATYHAPSAGHTSSGSVSHASGGGGSHVSSGGGGGGGGGHAGAGGGGGGGHH